MVIMSTIWKPLEGAEDSIWKPLEDTEDSIRVVDLLPGKAGDTICLRLRQVRLSKRPKYNAVSYTWGTETSARLVLLDDEPFVIRQNLWDFLVILRRRRVRTLWVDAFCICQTSLDEKGQQVQMIGQIFRSARSVRAWLGNATPSSDRVFEEAVLCEDEDAFRRRHVNEPGHDTRHADLEAFWECPYWTRMWIVQEIFLAQSLLFYCGTKSMTWEQVLFTTFICPVLGNNNFTSHFMQSVLMWKDPYTIQQMTLREFLRFGWDGQCANKLDRIYSVLSLIKGNGKFPIKVDYTLTPMELLLRCLKYLSPIGNGDVEALSKHLDLEHEDVCAFLAEHDEIVVPDSYFSKGLRV